MERFRVALRHFSSGKQAAAWSRKEAANIYRNSRIINCAEITLRNMVSG
ncbi:hypothetical protein SAMN05216364_100488 [Porphyromonadaceae bacterium KHP3R9]|nr:hypothetical protein SAMN05216364_100488 [Porphyromonadaceae bacterium KHP3R9]